MLKSVSFVCTSFLYLRNPDLTAFQMLLMRSVFALIVQVIYVNKDLKHAVWDGVNRTNVGPLITRVSMGCFTNIVNYSVTKFLSLTFIAVVNNMGPPLTVLLCYFFLKERIAPFETAMLSLTVIGILLYAIAGVSDTSEGETDRAQATKVMTIVMYVALCFNPIMSAVGTIAMRKMKKFHEAIVSFYLNIGIGVTALIVIWVMGSGFNPIANFDTASWLLSIGTGITGVSSQTARFIALKL